MNRQTHAQHGSGVKLVVFDFDQTLSVCHVFKSLAGWDSSDPLVASFVGGGKMPFHVPAPYARTEVGQIKRIEELSADEFAEEGGFARAAFGGMERVQEVNNLLQGLHAGGAELIVCTKGLVGAVRKCLLDLDLLRHFSEVYGNVGDSYGMTAYDRQLAEGPPPDSAERFLGKPHQANWGTKDQLISELMKKRGLKHNQCALVEDDPEEIRRAGSVCRTVLVREASGVTEKEIQILLQMVAEVHEDRHATPRSCAVQ